MLCIVVSSQNSWKPWESVLRRDRSNKFFGKTMSVVRKTGSWVLCSIVVVSLSYPIYKYTTEQDWTKVTLCALLVTGVVLMNIIRPGSPTESSISRHPRHPNSTAKPWTGVTRWDSIWWCCLPLGLLGVPYCVSWNGYLGVRNQRDLSCTGDSFSGSVWFPCWAGQYQRMIQVYLKSELYSFHHMRAPHGTVSAGSFFYSG